ncbi:MAG: galactokinase, partial [Actinomycetota bacterium]|nr:galactokinase [Actinomycetota bacterium]
GRVNLIGEHTDYNGGFVLPIAVEQGTYMLIRQSEIPPIRLYSATLDREATIYPEKIEKQDDWANYVRGVCLYAKEIAGELPSFDAFFFGDLPLESGLSSSASLEVVTAAGLESLSLKFSKLDIVKITRRAENNFVGVPCGIMDQYAVTFAKAQHAILLDCSTLESHQVPCRLGDCVLVVGHTGVRRALTDSEYAKRISECNEALSLLSKRIGQRKSLREVTPLEFNTAKWSLPEKLRNRAEHVIYENLRVEQAAKSLELGDMETLGYLMNRSHESLRDLFEVSSQELNALQEISLQQNGVRGCRMTGAGFGGCVITLIKKDWLERYLRRVPELYWQATHCDASFIATTPAEGARKIEL